MLSNCQTPAQSNPKLKVNWVTSFPTETKTTTPNVIRLYCFISYQYVFKKTLLLLLKYLCQKKGDQGPPK